MIKIRLHGTLDQIEQAKEQLKMGFNILSDSKPYKDRGKNEYYRVYLECEVVEDDKKTRS